MQQHKLSFKNSLINYYVSGSGDKTLFCLHGYGEDGASFSFLEKYIGETYTLYAIDFPFHGATKWSEKAPLSEEDLLNIFNSINKNQNDLFSLLAYSMGGRIAMHLLQKFPGKTERIVLIAPDGLRENFWYKISTQTKIGNKLFKKTMQQPGLFFSFLNAAEKINLLNKSIVKFVHNYLDDKNERILLYKRWTVLRAFEPNLSAIKKICSTKNIQVYLLFGSFDKIILSKRAGIFKQSKNIHIKIIEAGHQLLKEKYASSIVSLLDN
jgi:pimeloyl-ACP methyl ester carboxylesterase